jgi:hypothetical protein
VDSSNGCNVTCNVSLTVTDVSGLAETCETSVTIQDTVAPDITCPSESTIECDESTDPDNTGEATATDDCDSNPTIDYSDVVIPGDCPNKETITRTWRLLRENQQLCANHKRSRYYTTGDNLVRYARYLVASKSQNG